MTATIIETAGKALGSELVRLAMPNDAVDGVVPGVIVSPRSAEDVAAALRWATNEQLSVVITGSGTKVEWGRLPARIDVGLSMARMNRVIEHAAGDLTATIEAGALLQSVNATLGTHRQFLPLDPSYASRATIGGILATNDSGPLRHRYGTPSDLVLGVTVATADGLVAKSGGKVVKNVAGYDLGRLLAGSHGSLAAIVSATFKLVPLPEATSTIAIAGAPEPLLIFLDSMREQQVEPLAVEIAAQGVAGAVHHRLFVGFGSDRATVAQAIERSSAIATSAGLSATQVGDDENPFVDDDPAPRVFSRRTVLRLSWLPGELPAAMRGIATAAGATPWLLAGRASIGAGWLGIDGALDEQKRVIDGLRRQSSLGHVVIIKGPKELRAEVDVWPPSPVLPLWARLKGAWDPTSTLGAERGPL